MLFGLNIKAGANEIIIVFPKRATSPAPERGEAELRVVQIHPEYRRQRSTHILKLSLRRLEKGKSNQSP